jgi:hypothetical protein
MRHTTTPSHGAKSLGIGREHHDLAKDLRQRNESPAGWLKHYAFGVITGVNPQPEDDLPVLPDNYAYVVDASGAFVTDDSDSEILLIVYTGPTADEGLPSLPAGYAFLVDDAGNYLIDSNLDYMIYPLDPVLESLNVPAGYALLVDSVGNYILDNNSDYIIVATS